MDDDIIGNDLMNFVTPTIACIRRRFAQYGHAGPTPREQAHDTLARQKKAAYLGSNQRHQTAHQYGKNIGETPRLGAAQAPNPSTGDKKC
ncbi:hypothetical protein [Denitromonas iodatirespirans]|uniref:Uncharacterized protein n=1 Tax=Denitromonas iodatirespirans TaxID=2795389 RepID=A0A944H845_DENI1|nr:hypothetical protein [Denitromonas iodatirespirans]MBT0961913.1 hypothetical protein [Denitromonas iodatirespirans]